MLRATSAGYLVVFLESITAYPATGSSVHFFNGNNWVLARRLAMVTEEIVPGAK